MVRYLPILIILPGLCLADQQQEVWRADDLLSSFLETSDKDNEACFEEIGDLEGVGPPAIFQAAENAPPVPLRRLMIAVDASGSMAGSLGRQTKMTHAREATDAFLASVPDDVETGLVAFGHRGTNDDAGRQASCQAVETLVPLTTDRATVQAQIDTLSPRGWTPLADALTHAGAAFQPSETPGEQVIYVVSDGEETCGGDPVQAAAVLRDGDTKAVINIIGFDLAPDDRTQLEAVAEAGGGIFTEVSDADEARSWLNELRRTNANNIEILQKRNQVRIRQLRNSNQVSIQLLKMENCISGNEVREKNGLYAYARQSDVPFDVTEQAILLLEARYDRYRSDPRRGGSGLGPGQRGIARGSRGR
ncbi:vWA domain-containing protein [Aestuariibius sp. 2305UL40-4]|uniref:vWA domain-containing protein n=1 Tax=Aestuariibius violaceus TaxID=3234132 RepID=UPI003487A077